MLGRENCDFSFSGLKTAVRHLVEGLGAAPTTQQVADVAASFQVAVSDVLADRTARAIKILQSDFGGTTLVVAGGVAANAALRHRLEQVVGEHGIAMVAPPPALCTDNGAMIAWAGVERLALGLSDPLDVAARARWPLDAASASLIASRRRGRST
jgi:N6-L-threonylcarbamoyladenine synthase